MLVALLLAAAAQRLPTSMEGRMALLEARQMLEAQQVWALKAELPQRSEDRGQMADDETAT